MRTQEEDDAKNRLFVSCPSAENFHSQIPRLKKNRPKQTDILPPNGLPVNGVGNVNATEEIIDVYDNKVSF